MKEAMFNQEAEMSALGSIMLQESVAKSRKVLDMLELRDFYLPVHRKIFECFSDLLKRGIALDMITIPAWFDKPTQAGGMKETIDSVGGLEYIWQVAEAVPDSHNAGYYAETIQRLAFLRRLRDAAAKVAKDVIPSGKEPAEMYAETVQLFAECKPKGSEMVSLSDLKTWGKPQGVPTNLPSLNNVSGCGGLPKGQMTILAARKKVGKTSGLISFAVHAASSGMRIGYYTIADLDRFAIKQRIIQQLTGWGKVPNSIPELEKYDAAVAEVETIWDFYIRDLQTGSSVYAEELAVIIDQDNDQKKFDLVCIDYGQKLKSRQTKDRTPAQEIASSIMSELAATCGFALVVGSQITKEGQTSHSQEWENDCGLFVMFTRPDIEQEPVEIDIPYNRFGGAGSFDGKWDKYRAMVTE